MKYVVTMSVVGTAEIEVDADSPEEAAELATEVDAKVVIDATDFKGGFSVIDVE